MGKKLFHMFKTPKKRRTHAQIVGAMSDARAIELFDALQRTGQWNKLPKSYRRALFTRVEELNWRD
jgi:hypothetical protein